MSSSDVAIREDGDFARVSVEYFHDAIPVRIPYQKFHVIVPFFRLDSELGVRSASVI